MPQILKQGCRPVSDLPAGELSSAATARLWGQDRAALAECRRRHRALVGAIEIIEGQAAGEKKR